MVVGMTPLPSTAQSLDILDSSKLLQASCGNGLAWTKERCQGLRTLIDQCAIASGRVSIWRLARQVMELVKDRYPHLQKIYSYTAVGGHLTLKNRNESCGCWPHFRRWGAAAAAEKGLPRESKHQKTVPAADKPLHLLATAAEHRYELRTRPDATLRSHRALSRGAKIDCERMLADMVRVRRRLEGSCSREQFLKEFVQRVPTHFPWSDWGTVGAHLQFSDCRCRRWVDLRYPRS